MLDVSKTIVSYTVTTFHMVSSLCCIIIVGNANANIPLMIDDGCYLESQNTMYDSLTIISGSSAMSTTGKCGDDSLMAASRPLMVPEVLVGKICQGTFLQEAQKLLPE